MTNDQPRVIAVRHGDVVPVGSWLYAWIDTADASVAYVGATGFDPELRAHLHLNHDDPAIARVRTLVPRALERDFDVLVFPLPEGASRPLHKQALKRRLFDIGLIDRISDDEPLGDVDIPLLDAVTDAITRYTTHLTSP